MRFIYIMDPMCAWCYGFQPELATFLQQHAKIEVAWIMGGLAPESKQPMDVQLRQTIASYWHQIEAKTQVTFNHDYWQHNTPYRSTYPACRAVIAAENMIENGAEQMVKAIQSAYYQQARNPSLQDTLVACASSIDLDEKRFLAALTSQETEQQLQQHLKLTYQLKVTGFPALFYINKAGQTYALTLGFCKAIDLVQRFNQLNN